MLKLLSQRDVYSPGILQVLRLKLFKLLEQSPFRGRVGIHFNRRSESILSRLFKKKEPLDARFKVNFLVSEFFFSVERWDKSRG